MKRHNELNSLGSILKKGLKILDGGIISIPKNFDMANIGLKTWGKIDYLIHYRGYKLLKES